MYRHLHAVYVHARWRGRAIYGGFDTVNAAKDAGDAMANISRTDVAARLADDDVMELLNWHPERSTWCQEYTHANQRPPAAGWRRPSTEWIDWARGVLCDAPADMDGFNMIAAILGVAEALHPIGLEQQRLSDALLALGHLRGQNYEPADGRVRVTEDRGIVRTERMDLWRPGMASGSGWRTFCRLTLHGKSLVDLADTPEAFPVPEPEPPFGSPARTPPKPWVWRGAEQQNATTPEPSEQIADTDANKSGILPDDFSWTGPFVENEVRKFFARHRDDYCKGVLAVANRQMTVEEFGLQFGPKRIADWINDKYDVHTSRCLPCSKSHVHQSPGYVALVKTFKQNPDGHAVVKKLHHGHSQEVQDILDAFLINGEWDEDAPTSNSEGDGEESGA